MTTESKGMAGGAINVRCPHWKGRLALATSAVALVVVVAAFLRGGAASGSASGTSTDPTPTVVAPAAADGGRGLRTEVFGDGPEPTSVIERVRAIRRYTYRMIDFAMDGRCLLDCDADGRPTPYDYYHRDADDLLAAFRRNKGGVYCGGIAYAAMRIYEVFGIPSVMFDYGSPKGDTHVTNLVKLPDGHWYFHCATFDVELVDTSGSPLPIERALSLLRDRRADEVVVLNRDQDTPRDVHVIDGSIPFGLYPLPEKPFHRVGNRAIYRTSTSLDQYARGMGERIGRFLESQGLPPDMNYLMLIPLVIDGPEPHASEVRRIVGLPDKLDRRRINAMLGFGTVVFFVLFVAAGWVWWNRRGRVKIRV